MTEEIDIVELVRKSLEQSSRAIARYAEWYAYEYDPDAPVRLVGLEEIMQGCGNG